MFSYFHTSSFMQLNLRQSFQVLQFISIKYRSLSSVYYSARIEFRNHSYSTRKLHFMYVVFFPLFFHSLVVCHFATAVDEILWFRVECSQPWTWGSLLVDLNASEIIFNFLSLLKDIFRYGRKTQFWLLQLRGKLIILTIWIFTPTE